MDNNWYQQSLMPPEVYEFNLRIGVVPSTDHVQWMVEVKDPMTGVLIGQASGPHASYTRLLEAVDSACARLRDLVASELEPF
jgi:hypothetical protein